MKWFMSDLHLGHDNMYTLFKRVDGSPARPFTSFHDADRAMMENTNARVQPGDVLYILGDVAMGNTQESLNKLNAVNCKKKLILGNHDKTNKIELYLAVFSEVCSIKHFDNVVLTHVPLHPSSLERWGYNVHGHLHHHAIPDTRYINVCVEHTNYGPISYDELKQRMQ